MGVPYVGPAPNSDSGLVNKQYVDTRYGQIKVDLDYVNSAAAAVTANLVTQSYVDTQDATRAKKTAVDAADANYILATQRGVANGVASLGSDGMVPTAQLPATLPDRVPVFINATTVLLSSRNVVSTSTKEFLAATIEVADPGYPYYPLVFGSITGYSGVTQSQIRRANSGSLGKMVVLSPTDFIWAAGVAGGTFQPAQYEITPTCSPNSTPTLVPPITGPTTLTLWLSLYSGTSYTFTNEDLSFYTMISPGL